MDNNKNTDQLTDNSYQKRLLDILSTKQDMELSINDFRKKQEDYLSATEEWNKLIEKSVNLNNNYNNLVNEYNNYNTHLGSIDSNNRISKSSNLEYFGFIFLIISMIFIIIHIVVTREETSIENIILTIMIIIFIYYIYISYNSYIGNIIQSNTPPVLYKWIPEGIRNFFISFKDAINNTLLNFDYVK